MVDGEAWYCSPLYTTTPGSPQAFRRSANAEETEAGLLRSQFNSRVSSVLSAGLNDLEA